MADWRDRASEFLRERESLSGKTRLGLGGEAEYFAEPRSPGELRGLLADCDSAKVPVRILGTGSRLVVREDVVPGVVVRLSEPAFAEVRREGNRLRLGAGMTLARAVEEACQAGLSGLENLVGLPGTLGAAVVWNAGDRSGEIGDAVRSVGVLDRRGQPHTRPREEMSFAESSSGLEDPVVIEVELELQPEDPGIIATRLKRSWIGRKAVRPFLFDRAIRAFKNPAGFRAAQLIENAGISEADRKLGGASLSERNAAYVVAQPGATARDILGLMERIEARVAAHSKVRLEREAVVW